MEFDPNFTHIRRHDRAVTDEAWIEAFLKRAPFGVLATALQDQPFMHGILFVYDPQEQVIYLHSANQGRTIDNVRQNPKICFTVAEMGRLLPNQRARGFSVEYGSVVVYGQARLIEDPQEMLHGLRLLMSKYAPHLKPGVDYQELSEAELGGMVVYRLEIAAWSAKRKLVEEDFPGAYRFEEVVSRS